MTTTLLSLHLVYGVAYIAQWFPRDGALVYRAGAFAASRWRPGSDVPVDSLRSSEIALDTRWGPLPLATALFEGDTTILVGADPLEWTAEEHPLTRLGSLPYRFESISYWHKLDETFLVGATGFDSWAFIPWPPTVGSDGVVAHTLAENALGPIAAVEAEDLDSDGVDELVTTIRHFGGGSSLRLYEVLETGAVEGIDVDVPESCPNGSPDTIPRQVFMPGIGDLDRDGMSDVVWLWRHGCGVVIWGGTERPLRTSLVDPGATYIVSGYSVLPATAERQGHVMTYAVTDDGESSRAWRVEAGRRIVPANELIEGVYGVSAARGFPAHAVDVDNDGKLDLLSLASGIAVTLWRDPLPDGGYAPPPEYRMEPWVLPPELRGDGGVGGAPDGG